MGRQKSLDLKPPRPHHHSSSPHELHLRMARSQLYGSQARLSPNALSSSHPSSVSSLTVKKELVGVSVPLLIPVTANAYTAFIVSGTVLSALHIY